MSKKQGRKRRAHPDSDDEVDINGASDDDFDPRELLAVKQITDKRRTPPTRLTTRDGEEKVKSEEEEKEQVAVDGDEEGDDGEGPGDGVETVSAQELERLKRGRKAKREDRAFINNEVSCAPPTHLPLPLLSLHPRVSAADTSPALLFCVQAALTAKLEEIALPSSWPWVESLTIPTVAPLSIPDPHDDLHRESQFYTATQAAVLSGLQLLQQHRIPYLRPSDFYAEMVKPDAHMARVKDALIREKSRMDAVEGRKKEQTARKFAKQVQVNRVQEKQREKRENLQAVARQRHSAKNSPSVLSEHSTLPGVDEAMADVKQRSEAKRSRKREAKEAKYGFGGKKRRVKSNDRDSVEDLSGFQGRDNKKMFPGMRDRAPRRGGRGGGRGGAGGGRGGGGAARGGRVNNRPGKARRQASRT